MPGYGAGLVHESSDRRGACMRMRRRFGCILCTIKASGALPASLASLDALQVLRMDRNWINGTLPPEWAYGFPNLIELRLDYNSLTVRNIPQPSPCHDQHATISCIIDMHVGLGVCGRYLKMTGPFCQAVAAGCDAGYEEQSRFSEEKGREGEGGEHAGKWEEGNRHNAVLSPS